MIKCDGCHKVRDEMMFAPVLNGQRYEHLGLVNVCILCQVRPRTCTRCGEIFPATDVWFYHKERGYLGLHSIDKECSSNRSAEYFKRTRVRKGESNGQPVSS